MKINILTLDGVFDTGLATLLDTFAAANDMARRQSMNISRFEVQMIAVTGQVKSAHGLSIPAHQASGLDYPDWIVVPAINVHARQSPPDGWHDIADAKRFLQNMAKRGVKIAAACLNTFILADSRLLNEQTAAASWLNAAAPILPGAMMGHVELALWLIRQSSPPLADLLAKAMAADIRHPQVSRLPAGYLQHADDLINRFAHWSRAHLAQGFSLQAAAGALNVHPRTLQRRMEAALGKSPLAFFQQLRVERVKQLLAEGKDIETITADVGYSEVSTLLALLRRQTGKGIRALRHAV
ncbi:helix-turn-helix domain-containing protein [Klebsiella aerogenes]